MYFRIIYVFFNAFIWRRPYFFGLNFPVFSVNSHLLNLIFAVRNFFPCFHCKLPRGFSIQVQGVCKARFSQVLRYFFRNQFICLRNLMQFNSRHELRRCVRARTRAMCGRTCACACEKTSKTCVRCACVRAFLSWSHTTHVRPHLTCDNLNI